MQYRSTLVVFVLVVLFSACGDNREVETRADGCVRELWYADVDGDGFGDANADVLACLPPAGHVADSTDCKDSDATTYPGAIDACGDGLDQDCAGDDPLCFAERDGWTLTSGRLIQGSTPELITGVITFTKLSGNAQTRGGGACFVADLVHRGIGAATCTTDADCTTTIVGGFGYCAKPDGSAEDKRCWTRPGSGTTHCIRNAANTPGDKMMTEVPWDVDDAGTPVRWMILGCLAEEATAGACGLTDPTKYVRSNGPARTWM